MKLKDYEKPSMKVVLLQQRMPLLVGSGDGDFNAPDYPGGDNPFA